MRVVTNVAKTGRTVVCTIHQPNAAIFSMFDQLLLMQRGGFVVFNGPIVNLQPYLESLEGTVPKAALTNVATWMLDVISDNKTTDLPAAYLQSDFHARTNQEIEEATKKSKVSRPAEPLLGLKVFNLVFKRMGIAYFRNVDYNFARIMVFTVLGMLFGLVYFRISDADDIASITTAMAAVFMTSVFSGAIHMLTSLPVIGKSALIFIHLA